MKKSIALGVVCLLMGLFICSCMSTKTMYTIHYTTYSDVDMESTSIASGEILKEPSITKEGYNFLGWYDDPSFETKHDFSKPITKDYYLYARWEKIKKVSISFYLEFDSLYLSKEVYVHTKLSLVDLTTPTKEGYDFIGWSLEEHGEVVPSDYEITEDSTFFAQWSQYFSVSFMNGSTLVTIDKVTSGKTVSKHDDLVKEGYEFDNWYSDENFTEVFDFSKPITQDTILYAHFLKQFTVSFYVDGEIVDTYKVSEGKYATEPLAPVKEGFKFMGWRKTPTSTVNYQFKTAVTKDLNLYAKFLQKYTIHFETNGGTTIPDEVVLQGYRLDKPISPTLLDKYFAGWFQDEALTISFDFNSTISSSFTLYAKFVDSLAGYESVLYDSVPDIITEDLILPTMGDGVTFTWISSDTHTISNSGEINPGHKDIEVTISLKAVSNGVTFTYSKFATIKKMEFEPLVNSSSVFGYASAWFYPGSFSKEILETTDVIFYSFAYLYDDFSLDLSQNGFERKIESVLKARKSGVRVVLSVQGYGSEGENFSKACSTAANRKTLIDNIIACVELYHFDGVDIDWEYPGYQTGTDVSIDKVNYTNFVTELSNRFHALSSDYIVSAALPGGPWGYKRYELQKVGAALDFVNLMTYDLTAGNTSTHHTGLYKSSYTYKGCTGDETVKNFIANGIPAEKLTLGCAFYGKYVTITNTGNGQGLGATVSGSYKTMTYSKIYANYLNTPANVAKYSFYDEVSCAAYIYDASNNRFLTYDSVQSIKVKCEYVKSNKLGGIMIWELGEDSTNQLINAIATIK